MAASTTAAPAAGEELPGRADARPRQEGGGGAAEARPRWARPALAGVMLLAAVLMFAGVTVSGYGNEYYAVGAQAAGRSWRALFFNAADLGEYVTLDKGPLPAWLMGLSVRVFGFGSFALMIPGAVYATASVGVLYDGVRRLWGYRVATTAALLLALTPVAVLVGRYNTPDALLLLLLVCTAWAVTRTLQTAALRHAVLAGVVLGLAFNTKMLEAYVLLPAAGAAIALASPASLRRRALLAAAFLAALLSVSFAWYGAMMLIPAGSRPYVGDSAGNSWFQLILEGNGLKRVTGGGNFGSELEGRALTLFSRHVGGQIAWLLILSLAGVLAGVADAWRARSPRALGALLLWGGWGVTAFLLFSLASGIVHAYYTSVLAPPAAVLAAFALVRLWDEARDSAVWAVVLGCLLAATGTLAFVLLAHAATFVPWLRWVCFFAGCAAALLVVLPHISGRLARVLTPLALLAAALAVAAGPAAYSIATAGRAHTGSDPIAGPRVGEQSSFPGGVRSADRVRNAALLLPAMTRYMQAHQEGRRLLAGVTDARTADPVALLSAQPVITIGGFQGGDPAPSVAQIESLVGADRLRFVLLDAQREWPRSAPPLRASRLLAIGCRHLPLTVIDPSLTPARLHALAGQPLSLFDCAPARTGGG